MCAFCRRQSSEKTNCSAVVRQWATRDWTPQALLAPSSVEFFASEGQRLGDKSSLESLLHSMADISVSALQGTPHCEFSELDQMSWIARRNTRKPEDKAYALLGLFDVQMPLIYGEGEEQAFDRLRREVGIRSGRVQAIASELLTSPYRVLPCLTQVDRKPETFVLYAIKPKRNIEFVARTDIMNRLMGRTPLRWIEAVAR